MATALPAQLKAAAPDVVRFARRAGELATLRPIVTYWCEYYVLQQILNRQLHSTDEECTAFAIQLMDKLEAYKTANATNDAIVDDVAAKAYIENFALATFKRGDDAQKSNRVTRQTADVFQAAGTFLDLLAIWGPLDPEVTAKSKFAKYHALRIAKALKAGEDPNATNPIVEPAPQLASETDDGIEAELKALEGSVPRNTTSYQPPSVEPALDGERTPSAMPGLTTSIDDAALSGPHSPQPEHDVSPMETSEGAASRTGSVGGGYFPNVQQTSPDTAIPTSSVTPSEFYSNAASTTTVLPPLPPSSGVDVPSVSSHAVSTPSTAIPTAAASTPAVAAPAPAVVPTVLPRVPPSGGGYRADDEAMLEAQKHAKWAISALNFEDVDTAVKELRIALRTLGAL